MASTPANHSITPVTGRFTDRAAEEGYLRATWPQLAARVRTTGLAGGLLFLLSSASDYQLVGTGWIYGLLLFVRLAAAAAGLALFVTARRKAYADALFDRLVAFEVIIAVAFLIIVAAEREVFTVHTLIAVAIVTAFYFFVPNVRTVQFFLPMAVSIGFVAVAIIFLEVNVGALAMPVILLVLTNALGYEFMRFYNRSQRAEHQTLLVQQELNARLRQEIETRVAAEESARTSSESFRRLFDAAPVAMILMGAREGNILRANEAAYALYGAPSGQQGERAQIGRFFADPEDRDRLLARLRGRGTLPPTEVHMRNLDGAALEVLLAAKRVQYQNDPCYIVGAVDITGRKNMEEKLRHLATTDALTGAHNRRFFFETAERELRRTARLEHPAAVLLLDIDHFKRINDTYGHAAGDDMLRGLVEIIEGELRDYDILGRLGGEEFAVLLADTSIETAMEVGDRLRAAVAGSPIATVAGRLKMTISIGVAAVEPGALTVDVALSRADRAMYRAKSLGRNRVELDGREESAG
jgi:diguanylate cyclase (GGDEF)-like protein/PAS domain S-box-containing protein